MLRYLQTIWNMDRFLMKWSKEQTKYKDIKAFVGHELIYEQLFLSLCATAQESDKVPVLKFCD